MQTSPFWNTLSLSNLFSWLVYWPLTVLKVGPLRDQTIHDTLCISFTILLLSLFIDWFIDWFSFLMDNLHLRVAHGPVCVMLYVMSHLYLFIIQENLCYCMSCLVTVCPPPPPPFPSKYQNKNVNLHPFPPTLIEVLKMWLMRYKNPNTYRL